MSTKTKKIRKDIQKRTNLVTELKNTIKRKDDKISDLKFEMKKIKIKNSKLFDEMIQNAAIKETMELHLNTGIVTLKVLNYDESKKNETAANTIKQLMAFIVANNIKHY